ncbi:MAG TPA: MASE1 domain-containing protein [Terriglobales bacterium]|nr:MASE1 domain-containing protein [Terriglobales bacterium]
MANAVLLSAALVNQMGSTPSRVRSATADIDSPVSTIGLVCLVGLLSYLVPRMEGALILHPQTAWPLWPGCAILVSVMVLVRRKVWPALMLASFAGFILYDLHAGVPVSSTAWFIPADTVQVLIAALGLRYYFDRVPRLNNVDSLAKYCYFAVFLAPFTAAFISARGIAGPYWTSWRISFLSEVLAFVTLTPAILSWISEGTACVRKPRSYHLEAATLIAGTVLLGYITFIAPGMGNSPVLLYSLLPFLLWSALRFGSVGITSSIFVLALLAIWGAVHDRGPFHGQGAHSSILSLQVFLFFAATPFLVLAALAEDRKLAAEALVSVSRRLIDAQEKERTRIARELHDDISQRVALVANELDQLQKKSDDVPAPVRTLLNELFGRTSEIANDLQSLSHELHSSKLEYLGITAAMRSFCKEFGKQQEVEIDFKSEGLPDSLDLNISICLFRVLQEALHNSAKHSGARHFEVRLWGTSHDIHLTVADSGVGFDGAALKQTEGLGLISMQERLKLLNGTFSIESQPKRGTTIHARVPLDLGEQFRNYVEIAG